MIIGHRVPLRDHYARLLLRCVLMTHDSLLPAPNSLLPAPCSRLTTHHALDVAFGALFQKQPNHVKISLGGCDVQRCEAELHVGSGWAGGDRWVGEAEMNVSSGWVGGDRWVGEAEMNVSSGWVGG